MISIINQQYLKTKLQVSIASTQVEKQQLISLRTEIYRHVGKHKTKQIMSDSFDENCLLIGVWKNGLPIASARIIISDPNKEWEHDRFIKWDQSLPDRLQTVEISRFCIVYHERSWATIKALCFGIALVLTNTKRRYFLACCTDELAPFYRIFFGAKFTGHSIIHSDLGPKMHHIFFCDYQLGMVGKNIGVGAWLSLWPKPAYIGLKNGTLLYWLPKWKKRLFLIKCFIGMLAEPIASYFVDFYRRHRINNYRRSRIANLRPTEHHGVN